MSFKQKRILMKTFVESQFMVMYVYQFLTKANSYENICLVSAWSYLSLRVTTKTEALWRHLLSLSLNLCKFNSFKQNRTSIKTFVETQFEVTLVHEFQTKAISYEGICWVCLKLSKFTMFKQKRILMKTLVESQFEVMQVYEFQQKRILLNKFVESQFKLM